MRITKRQSAPHQIIGQIRRRGKSRFGSFEHRAAVGNHRRHHVGKCAQTGKRGIKRVKQPFLVFLVVLVIGKRLTFHQRQKRKKIAVHTPAFAANQLGHIGIFLLRHDGRAGAKTVGQIHKAESGTVPQNEFFGKTRQMHMQNGGGSTKFDGEIAVGHGVERIAARPVEA